MQKLQTRQERLLRIEMQTSLVFKFISCKNWNYYSGFYRVYGGITRSRAESMTLVVKCRGCGYVFPSRVQIDQLEYGKTAILEDRTETCPKCGKTSNYNTEDYWFQS
jgi:DNA-directed RNA polymerase subunit M/transcription elongation factor TFIIS